MTKNYGFIAPVIEEKNYVFGASPLTQNVLQPDGQWLSLLPKFEPQRKQLETSNCTGFGSLNIIEILLRKLNIEDNYSDRYLGIVAGTYPPGNDPNTVAQAVRHNGVLEEKYLPFSDDLATVDEYYSFNGADETDCRAKGKKWLELFDYGHEYVPNNQISMMEALKYSPLGASVVAWQQEDGLYYKRPEQQDNHWITIVGYEEGQYWVIYDSYESDSSPIKKLRWDYPFGYVKRYSLGVRPEIKETLSWMERILLALKEYFKDIMR